MHLAKCLQYSGHLIMNVRAGVFHELPLSTLYHQILFISSLHFHDDTHTHTRIYFKILPSFSFAWSAIVESSSNVTSLWKFLWLLQARWSVSPPGVSLWANIWPCCNDLLAKSFPPLILFSLWDQKSQCGAQHMQHVNKYHPNGTNGIKVKDGTDCYPFWEIKFSSKRESPNLKLYMMM